MWHYKNVNSWDTTVRYCMNDKMHCMYIENDTKGQQV